MIGPVTPVSRLCRCMHETQMQHPHQYAAAAAAEGAALSGRRGPAQLPRLEAAKLRGLREEKKRKRDVYNGQRERREGLCGNCCSAVGDRLGDSPDYPHSCLI